MFWWRIGGGFGIGMRLLLVIPSLCRRSRGGVGVSILCYYWWLMLVLMLVFVMAVEVVGVVALSFSLIDCGVCCLTSFISSGWMEIWQPFRGGVVLNFTKHD